MKFRWLPNAPGTKEFLSLLFQPINDHRIMAIIRAYKATKKNVNKKEVADDRLLEFGVA